MLALTMKNGDDFYVDDTRFVFRRGSDGCHLLCDPGALIALSSAPTETEIMPGVHATIVTGGDSMRSRISLSAPRSVAIDRGDLYRRCGGHSERLKRA